MRIIGFAGKRLAGKSQAAVLLMHQAQVCGVTFRKASFVDTIVDLYAASRNITATTLLYTYEQDDYLDDLFSFVQEQNRKDKYYFPNQLVLGIGQEESVVIDDVSSIEELEVLWRFKAKVYKIEACQTARMDRGWHFLPGVDDGPAELDLASLPPQVFVPYGGYVYNNGTVYDLEREISHIVGKHIFREVVC